jgi:hypothetical protein
VEIMRIMVPGHWGVAEKNQPGPILTNKLGVVVCNYHPCYKGGVNRRTADETGPEQKLMTLSEKSVKQKGMGLLAQCEALSSNP